MKLLHWRKIALLSASLMLTATLSTAESIPNMAFQTEKTEIATLDKPAENTMSFKADYDKQVKENQTQEAAINQKLAFIFGHNYYEFPEMVKWVNEILERLNSGKQAELKAKAAANKDDWQTALLWAQKRQQSQHQATKLTIQAKRSLKTQTNAQLVIDITIKDDEQNDENITTTANQASANRKENLIIATEVVKTASKETTTIQTSDSKEVTAIEENKVQDMFTTETSNDSGVQEVTLTQEINREVQEISVIQANHSDELGMVTTKQQKIITITSDNDTQKMLVTENLETDTITIDGATLYMSKGCIACHGANGKRPILSTYPLIAGQNKDYIVAQMTDIKSGARHNGQSAAMKSLMPIVNDQEILVLADWLSSLPINSDSAATDTVMVKKGAELYQSKICMTCHGKEAQTSLMPNYPMLVGQNSQYVIAQMKDIKSGARNNGQTAVMKAIMQAVNEEDMQAIAQWLASLNGSRFEKLE
ncbi:cytochrome c4 family [Beggiatoa sp. PS]|nr:cytochrome c4 family [Beggiatoa sp. PS]